MRITLRSYSKINLGLAIGPARADGFHALTTVYQTLAAHDLVRVELLARPGISLSANDARLPLDRRNTVWKMLERALAVPDRAELGVRVHIEKRLPVQGGMGAGSANAAAALIGLERLLAQAGTVAPLPGAERLRLAAEVGSDVPLFLLGGTVLGLGRGEQVVPLDDLGGLDSTAQNRDAGRLGLSANLPQGDSNGAWEAVMALPNTGVSTPAAFRAWDAGQAALGLTPDGMTDRLSRLSRALASAYCEEHATGVLFPTSRSQGLAGTLFSSLVQTGILLNDFEEVVFRQHPFLDQIKRVLAGQTSGEQAVCAALSGSGSAVFGLYSDDRAAAAAVARLNRLGVRSLRTRTLGRADYWAGMIIRED